MPASRAEMVRVGLPVRRAVVAGNIRHLQHGKLFRIADPAERRTARCASLVQASETVWRYAGGPMAMRCCRCRR
jgi:hypothetical protein